MGHKRTFTQGAVFRREDFEVSLKDVARRFTNMAFTGQVKMVLEQDWRVDRLCPPFIDIKHVGRLLREGDTVLHIGQGDSSSCRYFNEIGPQHTSVCFADAVYLDPRTIIDQRLKQEPMFCGRDEDKDKLAEARLTIAEILRDEFLVPASMVRMAHADLGVLGAFSAKDFEILRIKARHYRTSPPHQGNVESRATYAALLEIIERKMNILVPNLIDGRRDRRSISRLGGRMILTPLSETDDQRLAMLERNPTYLQPTNSHDVHYAAMKAFQDVCCQPHQMILGDFRNTELPPAARYNLIEGCRSDAFLGNGWAEFLWRMVQHLTEDGMYVSDGILSAYSYEFFLNEFLRDFLDKAKRTYQVWIVVPAEEDTSAFYPPTYIAGVIVSKSEERIKPIRVLLEKRGTQMIRVSSKRDLLNIPQVRHQLAWTAFYQLCKVRNQDVEALPHHQVVAQLRSIPWNNGEPSAAALAALLDSLSV